MTRTLAMTMTMIRVIIKCFQPSEEFSKRISVYAILSNDNNATHTALNPVSSKRFRMLRQKSDDLIRAVKADSDLIRRAVPLFIDRGAVSGPRYLFS